MRFVCFLWRGGGFWKPVARYDGRHVAVLASMLRRHGGHRLTCIHDGNFELPSGIDKIQMPKTASIAPNYLPKLWAWSNELHQQIGERFACIDLDATILGDLAPLLQTPDLVRLWDHARHELYNTSLFAMEPGACTEVWSSANYGEIQRAMELAKYWTGDQSFVSHVLGPGCATFGERDGVFQYRPKLHRRAPPAGALAGFMCGPYEPFSEAEESQWVKAAYR